MSKVQRSQEVSELNSVIRTSPNIIFVFFLVADEYNLKGSGARFDGSTIPHGKSKFNFTGLSSGQPQA
jgi:hypothetical protein